MASCMTASSAPRRLATMASNFCFAVLRLQPRYYFTGIGHLRNGLGRNKTAKIDCIKTNLQQCIDVFKFFLQWK